MIINDIKVSLTFGDCFRKLQWCTQRAGFFQI